MQRQLMFFYHHFGSCLAQKRLHPRPYLFFDGKSKIGLAFGILYNQDPTLQLYFSNCHYIFAPGKILTCHFQNIFTFHFLVCLLVFSSRNAFFPFSLVILRFYSAVTSSTQSSPLTQRAVSAHSYEVVQQSFSCSYYSPSYVTLSTSTRWCSSVHMAGTMAKSCPSGYYNPAKLQQWFIN